MAELVRRAVDAYLAEHGGENENREEAGKKS